MQALDGIKGCGIGLRREFLNDLPSTLYQPDWYEITPENWIHMPYQYREPFSRAIEGFPLVAHGLSLSIGSPDPLNREFLADLKQFLDEYKIKHYSEHLSFSVFNSNQSYELLPLPMTEAMADFVADKVKEASDYLQRPIILENATYYHAPYAEMKETEFINRVLQRSSSPLLLDVNNVYVNSINHNFNAEDFINELNLEEVSYMHIAGHTYFEEEQVVVDTHGREVIDEVWRLLEYTLQKAPAPVLLERDNNVPPVNKIWPEYIMLQKLASQYFKTPNREKAGA